MKIAIGIPAYNEEKNVASIIMKLEKITNQIIVCNDGSTDLTGDIAKKIGAIILSTILMMTAILLYSLVNIVRERRN